MSKFGTITISNRQLQAAAKAYSKFIGTKGGSEAERFTANRVLRAANHNRVEFVELPMDSPLVDHLLYEQDGKLLQPTKG